MNAISLIRPYKHHGQWVFDDPRVSLDKEPFVAGADTLIDKALALLQIPNPDTDFLLLFSAIIPALQDVTHRGATLTPVGTFAERPLLQLHMP